MSGPQYDPVVDQLSGHVITCFLPMLETRLVSSFGSARAVWFTRCAAAPTSAGKSASGPEARLKEYLLMPDDRSLYRYRSDRGEMLTEEDMEAIFGDDITGLEGEDRDDVTFESWLDEMIDWGRYWRVDVRPR